MIYLRLHIKSSHHTGSNLCKTYKEVPINAYIQLILQTIGYSIYKSVDFIYSRMSNIKPESGINQHIIIYNNR